MTDTAQAVENEIPKVDLAVLRDPKVPLFIRNDSHRHILCNLKDNPLSLGPKGTATSVAALHPDHAKNDGIQRMWRAGRVTISADPALGDEINGSVREMLDAEEKRLADIQAVVEPAPAKRNLVEMECLITRERVFMTEQDVKDMVPPLADSVKELASQFVATQVPGEKGEMKVQFTRVQNGAIL